VRKTIALLAATLFAVPLLSSCSSGVHTTKTADPTATPQVKNEMGTTPIPKFLHDRWANQWTRAEVYDAPTLRVSSVNTNVMTLRGYSLYPCPASFVRVAPTRIEDYQETLLSDTKNKVEAHAAVIVFPTVKAATKYATAISEASTECTHLSTKANPEVDLSDVAVTSTDYTMTKTGSYHAAGNANNVLGRFSTRVVEDVNVVAVIDGWQDANVVDDADTLPAVIGTLQNEAAELITYSSGR
jgi:hypothetical protein